MLGYAPEQGLRSHRARPGTLTLIVGAHALALALVMTAKMELPQRSFFPPTVLTPIPETPEPPPPDRLPPPRTPAEPSHIDSVRPVVTDLSGSLTVDPGPMILPNLDPRPAVQPVPPDPVALAEPVRVGPKLATSGERLRPPYPDSKRRLEEEAVLKLKLTIGPDGRVTAVEPVGAADPVFLDSARKHILKNWRYQPATEDGRPVGSTLTITMRFELEQG